MYNLIRKGAKQDLRSKKWKNDNKQSWESQTCCAHMLLEERILWNKFLIFDTASDPNKKLINL